MTASREILIAALSVVSAMVAAAAAPTLDTDFGGAGCSFGSKDGWHVNAKPLVGDNRGSIFFDVKFDEEPPAKKGQWMVVQLRTGSRLSIGWHTFGHRDLWFSFSDREHTFRHAVARKIDYGRVYRLGCTWDGEAVRTYLDGRCVASGVQPLPVKAEVRNLNVGPFKDGWVAPGPWTDRDDAVVSRLRVWNVARSAEEVAAESGVAFEKLEERSRVLIGEKPVKLPGSEYAIAADREKLKLVFERVLPGRTNLDERAEKVTLAAGRPTDVRRFSFSLAGESAGGWKCASKKAMRIDDTVFWTVSAEISWRDLGLDGPPAKFGDLVLDGRCLPVFGRAPAFRVKSASDPGKGEYREEFSIAATDPAEVRYELALARTDGRYLPMSVYDRTWRLKRSETLDDAFAIRTDAPGYDRLVHSVYARGELIARDVVAYEYRPELMEVRPLLLHGRVDVAFKRPVSATVALTGPDGREIKSLPADGGTVKFAFDRDWSAGEYRIAVKDTKGTLLGERKFGYPGRGEWEKQDFHPDWIVPPYEPMRSKVLEDALAVKMYGRCYGWRKSLLPYRVSSQGEDLLVEGVELLVDGGKVACERFETVSNAPHRVEYRANGGGAEVAGWLEYDGVNHNRFAVTPRAANASVAVRFTLKPAFAKYLHAAAGGGWGAKKTMAVPDGESHLGSFPVLWVGNEEKGLCFYAESFEGWAPAKNRRYRLEKTERGLTVTVAVAEKLRRGVRREFEFGFLATPMRPPAPNHPYDTLSWSYLAQFNRPGRVPVNYADDMTCDGRSGGDLGSFFCDLGTADAAKTEAVRRWEWENLEKGTGVMPCPYTCARFLSNKYPEVAAYLNDWTVRPMNPMDYTHTGHVVYECCPTTTASDFFTWRYKGMLKRFPFVRGVYFDFGVVGACENADHGCRGRTPLLGQREFYRRMAVAQMEAGIAYPLVVVHNTDCNQYPAITFASHLLNGEHVRQASSPILHDNKDIIDSYPLAMFAAELSMLPIGVNNAAYMPFDKLGVQFGGDPKESEARYKFRMGKAAFAALLPHATIPCLWRNHYGLFDKLIRAYEEFGVEKARFTGYWRNPVKVVKGDDVLVSVYAADAEPGRAGRRLLVIGHVGKPHVDQDVVLDLSSLGQTAFTSATDLMTKPDPDYDWLFEKFRKSRQYASRVPLELGDFGTRVISFDGSTLRYHLPFHSFGLVEIVVR